MNDKQHLEFMFKRLIHVYGESEHADYMIRFRKIIEKMPIRENRRLVMPTDEEILMRDAKESADKYNSYVRACRAGDKSEQEWKSRSWLYKLFHGHECRPYPIRKMPTEHRIIAERMGWITS